MIFQSAPRLEPAVKSARRLTVLMVGHLRDEKDPLTFIKAAQVMAGAKIDFQLIGDGLDASLAEFARLTTNKIILINKIILNHGSDDS